MEEEMEIQIMIPGKRSSSNESERAEKTPKKGKGAGASSSSGSPKCQVEDCSEDLTEAKEYYRRHRVCELHSKSRIVNVLGLPQRFCQQCSRFHVLEEFDEAKRSCRVRLAGHNERRRKTANDAFMISRLNGNWLKQQEETERLSLALHSGTPPKASNSIKNH